jgi:hypothetical protein
MVQEFEKEKRLEKVARVIKKFSLISKLTNHNEIKNNKKKRKVEIKPNFYEKSPQKNMKIIPFENLQLSSFCCHPNVKKEIETNFLLR